MKGALGQPTSQASETGALTTSNSHSTTPSDEPSRSLGVAQSSVSAAKKKRTKRRHSHHRHHRQGHSTHLDEFASAQSDTSLSLREPSEASEPDDDDDMPPIDTRRPSQLSDSSSSVTRLEHALDLVAQERIERNGNESDMLRRRQSTSSGRRFELSEMVVWLRDGVELAGVSADKRARDSAAACSVHALSAAHVWWLVAAVVHVAVLIAYGDGSAALVRPLAAALLSLLVAVLFADNELSVLLHRATSLLSRCSGAGVVARRVRAALLRLLHRIGGAHVAFAFWAAVWLTIHAASSSVATLLVEEDDDANVSPLTTFGRAAYGTAIAQAVLAWLLMVPALRVVRTRMHDWFEQWHRWGGVLLVVVVAAHLGTLAMARGGGGVVNVASLPDAYALALVGVLMLYPWLFVRRATIVRVAATRNHAAITLLPPTPTTSWPMHGFVRVSRNGVEWHAYALAHVELDRSRADLLVTRAGDWSGRLIDEYFDDAQAAAARSVLVRRAGQTYLNTLHAYRCVLLLCTGGAIGAAAMYWRSELATRVHLVWLANSPHLVYDERYLAAARLFASSSVVDTAANARPAKIGALVADIAANIDGLEAIYIVSNERFSHAMRVRLGRLAAHLDVFVGAFDN